VVCCLNEVIEQATELETRYACAIFVLQLHTGL